MRLSIFRGNSSIEPIFVNVPDISFDFLQLAPARTNGDVVEIQPFSVGALDKIIEFTESELNAVFTDYSHQSYELSLLNVKLQSLFEHNYNILLSICT